jgi:hypothetical protein
MVAAADISALSQVCHAQRPLNAADRMSPTCVASDGGMYDWFSSGMDIRWRFHSVFGGI